MRMLSAPVLAGAVLASSPALYQGFITRTVPMEDAGTRFAVALVIAWLAMSAVAMLVGEPPKPVVATPEAAESAPVTDASSEPTSDSTPSDSTPVVEAVAIGELSAGPGGGAPQAA